MRWSDVDNVERCVRYVSGCACEAEVGRGCWSAANTSRPTRFELTLRHPASEARIIESKVTSTPPALWFSPIDATVDKMVEERVISTPIHTDSSGK
jgi:hypothetical protein